MTRRRWTVPATRVATVAVVTAVAAVLFAPAVAAQEEAPPRLGSAWPYGYDGAVVVEPETWTILYGKNIHTPYRTASMIKMLTALVVVDAVEGGRASWDDRVEVTYDAALVGGRQAYLKQGEVFTIRELLEATLIHSANDAAFAVAEAVGGSVDEFVGMMRAKAEELGLEGATISSPNGLPIEGDPDADDRMSPLDVAKVAAAVLAEPELVPIVRTPTKGFRRGEFQLFSGNHLLRRYDAAIGVKTGYTRAAGFCLAGAAREDDMTLIVVVMGSNRKWDSFNASKALLQLGFERYELVEAVAPGAAVPEPAPVEGGVTDSVRLETAQGLRYLVERGSGSEPELQVETETLTAPVRPGEEAGTAVVLDRGRELARVPLVTAGAVDEPTLWQRLKRSIAGWFT